MQQASRIISFIHINLTQTSSQNKKRRKSFEIYQTQIQSSSHRKPPASYLRIFLEILFSTTTKIILGIFTIMDTVMP